MRLHQIAGLVLASLSFWGATARAQSLGDVARQQREEQAKKADSGSTSKKVITNEDMPEHPDSDAQGNEKNRANVPASNDLRSARQWKAAILQQEKVVLSMQKSLDELKSSVHFVEENRYYYGVQYNQRQMQKLQQVDQMQKRLDDQKKRLEMMQEAARRAGFGNAVYEP